MDRSWKKILVHFLTRHHTLVASWPADDNCSDCCGDRERGLFSLGLMTAFVQGSRTPECRDYPRARAAGVRKAPRHEIAVGRAALQRKGSLFFRSAKCRSWPFSTFVAMQRYVRSWSSSRHCGDIVNGSSFCAGAATRLRRPRTLINAHVCIA
jgi:hypothetical protein